MLVRGANWGKPTWHQTGSRIPSRRHNFDKLSASQDPREMIGSNFGEYPECFAKGYLIRYRVIGWLDKHHLARELGALEDIANESSGL